MIPDELKRNPYNYIRDYYESIYPFIGRKVFSILSLVPVSLIIPEIPRGKKKIKQKINLLLLSLPGSGKTSLASEFIKITYYPLFTEGITPARLYHEIMKQESKKISLVVSDVATIFSDDILVKILEQVLGEEGGISRNTMRNVENETQNKVDAVAYLSGTPENIAERRIRDGILFRTSPLIIFYSNEEHEKIIDKISESMGTIDEDKSVDYIKEFYEDLYKIQAGEHESYNPITGYHIGKEINEEVKNYIKPIVGPLFRKWGITSAREIEEMYRFMVAHAFLNIYNRQIINGDLVIEKEDLEIAKKLIKREVYTKNIILQCIERVDYWNIKTRNQLKEWEEKMRRVKKELPREAKFIMEGLVK